MSSTVRFCPECNNMLYPKEDRANRLLLFACRNCDHQEEADNYCVYRHDIILPAIEQSRSYSDFPSDPTLPRTNKRPCPKCKHAEAVFFQTHDRRRDTPMTLNFVCCNSSCNHASKLLCSVDLSKFPRKMQMIEVRNCGRLIDSGLGCFFKGPNSSTGEDVIEFNLHGSLAVIQQMRSALSKLNHIGLREAERGEFTKRSLLNNRMTLTEVEALGDLLEAETTLQLEICQSNLKGALEKRITKWLVEISDRLSEIEALIEFSDTDELCPTKHFDMTNLISEFKGAIGDSTVYEKLRTGFQIMILGPPNAGKSSFLNYLAKDYVSIVSDQAGTTRDLVKHDLNINGIPIKIIDSAGIRKATCPIESQGVKLAIEAAEKADLLLVLLNDAYKEFFKNFGAILKTKKTIFIQSLSDLPRQDIVLDCERVFKISSVTGEGIGALVSAIEQHILPFQNRGLSERVFFNLRQSEAIKESLNYLERAQSSHDLVIKSEQLRQSILSLRKIRGESFDIEDIYNRIFANFCIGK